ncbi:MAG: metallophosphatase family protein [Bryobacteraceae bacterium]|nr:metallophosphatase family protein [Bryobacteraceae bacterium]MDW8379538.1 metallophosphoesterase family protein [Bryobacterales bacterium]
MRFLILSDIHSNLSALQAVLADADGQYDRIVCLGDIVGYGAEPNEVTAWVRQHVDSIVRGNHDKASSGDPCLQDFNPAAAAAAAWTRQVLEPTNLEYVRNLPPGPRDAGGFCLSHGSPRDEDEYIVTRQDAIELQRELPSEICFFGHTHIQVGFGLRPGRAWLLVPPPYHQQERVYELEPDACYLLNPGSVGQPRDADPRAAYAIFDHPAKLLRLRRTPYDILTTQQRILEAGLPPVLAERLSLGR